MTAHPPTERPIPVARPPDSAESIGMRMLLPVGRSVWALVAGYLALFAVTLVPAPFALIFGIVAVIDIRRHPEKHGMGRAIFAIVAGGLFTLLLCVVVIVAVMD